MAKSTDIQEIKILPNVFLDKEEFAQDIAKLSVVTPKTQHKLYETSLCFPQKFFRQSSKLYRIYNRNKTVNPPYPFVIVVGFEQDSQMLDLEKNGTSVNL